MASRLCKPEAPYELSQIAVNVLRDPDVRLELHVVPFSHYCTRARWALAASGLDYSEVTYLPVEHMRGMARVLRRFKAARCAKTASSQSPYPVPALAVYGAKGQPLFLLRNSALIARWAALHAAARGTPPSTLLYGPSLAVASAGPDKAGGAEGQGEYVVSGGDEYYRSVSELELRLSNGIGIEVRRLIYFHLLPSTLLGANLFRRNARGRIGCTLWWFWYLVARVIIPKFLKINATTAARGLQLLMSEFDFFDALIAKREAEVAAATGGCGNGVGSVANGTVGAVAGAAAKAPLPFYLCGSVLSAADVSLATLAGPLVQLPPGCDAGRYYLPQPAQLPATLRDVVAALTARPTGQYIIRLWEAHGIALMAAGTSGGGGVTGHKPASRL